MKKISSILGLFIVAPIWYYLLYSILQRVDASELMWFLYWAYIPVALLVGIINKIVEQK